MLLPANIMRFKSSVCVCVYVHINWLRLYNTYFNAIYYTFCYVAKTSHTYNTMKQKQMKTKPTLKPCKYINTSLKIH